MQQLKRILISSDLTDSSAAAFVAAAELAQASGAEEILLVHVARPSTIQKKEGYPEDYPEYRVVADWERLLLEQFQTAVPAGDSRSFAVRSVVLPGEPAEQILEMAKVRDFDLIVLGTPGRKHLFPGLHASLAKALIAQAPCPVLVVPPASQAKKEQLRKAA